MTAPFFMFFNITEHPPRTFKLTFLFGKRKYRHRC